MASAQRLLVLAAALGASGVLLGAFGAHGLASLLPAANLDTTLSTWRTAVLYHLLHAVAVLALALYASAHSRAETSQFTVAACRIAWVWASGVLLFSGSLYVLAVGGPRWLGPVTPLGGLLMVAGWVWVGLLASKVRSQ